MVRKIMSVLVSFIMLFGTFGVVNADETTDFNLIEYLNTHTVESYSEFQELIAENSADASESVYTRSLINFDDDVDLSFDYTIDEDSQTVTIDRVYQTYTSTYSTSGGASKEVYSSAGMLIYTIRINGTFTRTSQTVVTHSKSGSFDRANGSSWTSSPTITSGSISRTQAYARIAGTASSSSQSRNYTLTLMCDTSGYLTSSYSS